MAHWGWYSEVQYENLVVVRCSQCTLELLGTTERQHELVETYVATLNGNGHTIRCQVGEVIDGKFVDFETLESMIDRHEFVQSVIQRFALYKEAIRRKIKKGAQ